MNDRDLGSSRQMIGHDLNEPHPSNISVWASCYRFGSDCLQLAALFGHLSALVECLLLRE
jgi:hypothetical protein